MLYEDTEERIWTTCVLHWSTAFNSYVFLIYSLAMPAVQDKNQEEEERKDREENERNLYR
jgi:hypothetical protein